MKADQVGPSSAKGFALGGVDSVRGELTSARAEALHHAFFITRGNNKGRATYCCSPSAGIHVGPMTRFVAGQSSVGFCVSIIGTKHEFFWPYGKHRTGCNYYCI